MNEKLQKLETEIAKYKTKITEYTARLRELERQKTETENAGIVVLVRDVDITPDELMAFLGAYRGQPGANTPTGGREGADESM